MSLFDAMKQVCSLPLRVAVDAVTFPANVMEGKHLAPNTAKGLQKIQDELDGD